MKEKKTKGQLKERITLNKQKATKGYHKNKQMKEPTKDRRN